MATLERTIPVWVRRLALGALAAGLALASVPAEAPRDAHAAPAAQPMPRPDLIDVQVKTGTTMGKNAQRFSYLALTFVDRTSNEDGYILIARRPASGAPSVDKSVLLEGEIAGSGKDGHGSIGGLTVGERYCVSVMAYTKRNGADPFSARSNEICLTMEGPTPPAANPAATWPTVAQGANGAVVATIQHLLRQHGSDTVVDGDFGPQTANDVRAFQRVNGLPVDGVVGPATWGKLVAVLREGSRGEAVRAAQRLLAARGAAIAVDGAYGTPTTEAVRAFQQAHGLKVTGLVLWSTWQTLLCP